MPICWYLGKGDGCLVDGRQKDAASECSFRLACMLGFPRIEQRNTDGLEVCNVAGDDCQAMNHRCRGDQGITFGAAIGYMKARATLRHGGIDSQDSAVEARQYLIVDPGAQNRTLRGVLARYQEDAKLDFQN